MRKLLIAGFVAAAGFAAVAPSAQAQDEGPVPYPCVEARAFMHEHGLEFRFYNPVLQFAVDEVCFITG